GSWPTVSPDGSVHVAFLNFQGDGAWESGECCEGQFLAVSSSDGGSTWSDPVHVVDMEDGSLDYSNCSLVFGALPSCTLSGSQLGVMPYSNLVASPVDGTLYLVFSDNRDGTHDVADPVTNADVFVMASTDGGTTWTGPDPVSTAPGDQWDAFAGVNPVTGELGVIYYDRTEDSPNLFGVTLATGLPGSFTSSPVATASSHLDKNLWFPAGVSG